jgi:cytoskeleton protein RodZ
MSDAATMMSSVDERGHPIASRTGADLRAARERLGWSVADIAQHLRIRQPFLECIEAGRISELPGNAYAVGFVRTYAQALGLDPDEMARRFRAEAAEVNRKTELTFPAPVPDGGVPAGALVLMGLAICIGAYVGWYQISGDAPRPQPVAAVPERLAMLAEPPPRPEPPAPVKPPAVEAPAQAEMPHVSSSPTQAQAAQEVRPPVSLPMPDVARVVLRAKADAWLQVRDKAGQMLLSRQLRAGESWPLPAKGQFLLTTGNAGGTEVLLDGASIGNFGGDGVVRRDVAIDPDVIADRKAVPALPLLAVAPPKPAVRQP